jgi:small-conductance mechanosensitive channel
MSWQQWRQQLADSELLGRQFGAEYDTPPDTLAAIPGMVREAIDSQEKTRFDRAHFKAFGDSSLVFEVVYYMLSPDYNLYMDVQQAINLTLVRRFADAAIRFAFPTQTLYVRRDPLQTKDGADFSR